MDYFSYFIVKTEVITIQTLKDYGFENVVFGREVFQRTKKDVLEERSLIYRLVKTVKGWRIYHIVY